MSHLVEELDRPMYGSREAAWHGLGVVVDGQPSAADAIKLAKLDWRVEKEPAYAPDGKGGYFKVNGTFFNARTDLPLDDMRRILGSVGSRYVPVQNSEAFAFVDALLAEGGARFETAGSLRNGRTVWMLAVLPDTLRVQDDTISKYVLLRNTHDGLGAWEALLTGVRVVCNNTLTAAVGRAKQRFAIRHTANATHRIEEARRALKLASGYFDVVGEKMNALAGIKMAKESATDFLKRLIPDPKEGTRATRAQHTREAICDLFAGAQAGAEQDAVKGTAYGLYQAAAEYADHGRTVRAAANVVKAEARMESVLWGSAADFKQRALDTLLSSLDLGEPAGEPLVESVMAQLAV